MQAQHLKLQDCFFEHLIGLINVYEASLGFGFSGRGEFYVLTSYLSDPTSYLSQLLWKRQKRPQAFRELCGSGRMEPQNG